MLTSEDLNDEARLPTPLPEASPQSPSPATLPALAVAPKAVSPLPIVPPPPNFTGSMAASDYVFNLSLPPRDHPIDIQIYLYALGAPDPQPNGANWDAGMTEGLRCLQNARAAGKG